MVGENPREPEVAVLKELPTEPWEVRGLVSMDGSTVTVRVEDGKGRECPKSLSREDFAALKEKAQGMLDHPDRFPQGERFDEQERKLVEWWLKEAGEMELKLSPQH